MTEAELKRAVLALAYRHHWLVFHMPADTLRGSQGRGYPDLTLAREDDRCPACGRACRHVELKADAGKVTPDQWAWIAALGGDGTADTKARVIRPPDLATLEDWLR